MIALPKTSADSSKASRSEPSSAGGTRAGSWASCKRVDGAEPAHSPAGARAPTGGAPASGAPASDETDWRHHSRLLKSSGHLPSGKQAPNFETGAMADDSSYIGKSPYAAELNHSGAEAFKPYA